MKLYNGDIESASSATSLFDSGQCHLCGKVLEWRCMLYFPVSGIPTTVASAVCCEQQYEASPWNFKVSVHDCR